MSWIIENFEDIIKYGGILIGGGIIFGKLLSQISYIRRDVEQGFINTNKKFNEISKNVDDVKNEVNGLKKDFHTLEVNMIDRIYNFGKGKNSS